MSKARKIAELVASNMMTLLYVNRMYRSGTNQEEHRMEYINWLESEVDRILLEE